VVIIFISLLGSLSIYCGLLISFDNGLSGIVDYDHAMFSSINLLIE